MIVRLTVSLNKILPLLHSLKVHVLVGFFISDKTFTIYIYLCIYKQTKFKKHVFFSKIFNIVGRGFISVCFYNLLYTFLRQRHV